MLRWRDARAPAPCASACPASHASRAAVVASARVVAAPPRVARGGAAAFPSPTARTRARVDGPSHECSPHGRFRRLSLSRPRHRGGRWLRRRPATPVVELVETPTSRGRCREETQQRGEYGAGWASASGVAGAQWLRRRASGTPVFEEAPQRRLEPPHPVLHRSVSGLVSVGGLH